MVLGFVLTLFFFFKQKTAYELRISDWSSDVCSSDLLPASPIPRSRDWRSSEVYPPPPPPSAPLSASLSEQAAGPRMTTNSVGRMNRISEIGRESWRERVCQYV